MGTITITNRIANLTQVTNSIENYIYDNDTGEAIHKYYLSDSNQSFHEYNHFRFIYKADGSLWHEANLFMFDYVKKQPGFSKSSFETYEQALREFIAFCEPLKDGKLTKFIDYEKADREMDAPTHRFRKHLIKTRVDTKVSITAIDRFMPPVCAFYDWKMKRGHKFNVDLWKETTVRNPYNGEEMITRDVCQYTHSASDGQYIYDNGKLRPLTIHEERLIRKALIKIGNPEYRFIFNIALNSMARKQTILTLRLRDILGAIPGRIEDMPKSLDEVPKWLNKIMWPSEMQDCSIIVGKGHGADVKNDNKNFSIKIKGWLLKKLVIYMTSQRAFERRALAFPQKSELDQYLFLSDKGNPMYHANNDPGKHNRKMRRTAEAQDGNSLDQFINNELRPWLRRRGYDIEFHFHCLRATGAVRFLEERGRKNNHRSYSPIEWSADIQALRQLMGHSNSDTTIRYLIYMDTNDTLGKVVDDAGEWYIEMMSDWDENTKYRAEGA